MIKQKYADCISDIFVYADTFTVFIKYFPIILITLYGNLSRF